MKKSLSILLALTLLLSANISTVFAAGNESSVVINGTAEATLITFTVPTTTSFVIKPNETEANSFVAPNFTVTNSSTAPIKVSIKEFKPKADAAYKFTDVTPIKYSDWSTLNKAKSESEIAISIVAKTAGEWAALSKSTATYATDVVGTIEIGTLNPNSSAVFGMGAKHGTAFSTTLTTSYVLVLMIELA